MTTDLQPGTAFDSIGKRPQKVKPATTLAEATELLRRPFTVHAVQFRILEGRDGNKANCATYIDSATAIDRLNVVCPGLWSDRFVAEPGGMACGITVDGQTRWDVGTSSRPGEEMGFKGLRSDAFKRAAVKFGVGISLRTLPNMQLVAHTKPFPQGAWVKAYPKMKNGAAEKDNYGNPKFTYYLTDAGQQELRKRYQKWLDETGRKAFGEPLDHGHVAGSMDAEESTPEPATAPTERVHWKPLPAEAQLVLEHASTVGHGALSDPETVSMMVAGMTAEALEQWAAQARAELNETQRRVANTKDDR